VAQQIEKLRENIVAVEKTLEDRSWRFGCSIAALQNTINKKEAQLQERQEKLRTLHTAVGGLQRRLQQAEALRDRWQKEFAKLNEWSERILRDFGRVLRSNRWRVGNWLSFKRTGEKSKEGHRLAQLVASRPRPASGGRDPAQVRPSLGKGKPGGTAASKNEQHVTFKKTANPRKTDVIDASPCSILFLMNLRAAGGGVNSIVQEADGLRKLGVAVQVAIRRQDESFYRSRFPGVARDLFHVSESIEELIGYARQFEFVVATAFKTVRTLKTVLEQAPGVVPCYYIQDYEPNFYHPSEANYREAVESYTLIPEMRTFAKTRWLCETVAQKYGVRVHKVEPSLDREVFFADERSKPGTPFVVCAMVRPMSEYRSPGLTFEILRRIKREFGGRVEIRMFGLEQNDPFLRRQPADFEYKVLGILDRQGVAKLMRESSLFIDASAYQAFGRTGLEAMACRCATILPSQGGISEYAVDGVNTLLAAPNDAGDMLRKVRRYISEPQLYQSIVEEGLKTAARYSIQKACASELEFFESLRCKPA
jgi:glycosyltransferase involved in cell wall biosynthesis